MTDQNATKNFSLIISDEEISLDSKSENYCVCIVDMIDSTRITSMIADSKKAMRYYSIFLNSMAAIARGYNARIIKNVGDSLIYYFPETSEITKWSGFKNVLESAITMILSHGIINAKLSEEKLPSVDYRISADYGKVEIAKSNSSKSEDFFGSTINICSKINLKACPNGLVIGSDLYRVLKSSFPEVSNSYSIKEIGAYSSGLTKSYPVYDVKNKLNSVSNFNKHLPESVDNRSSRCPNILIVEDQADLAFTYKTLLSEEGWEVNYFTDSEEALKHFAEVYPCPYDLVILDIRMPKLNGIQLFYRLKSIASHIRIIFISALDAAEELVSILPGVNYSDIIKKPILGEELVSRLRNKLVEE